ncbi:ferritin-like superfamily [Radiomyces spectabilis]|uniref:ferritin-like superfamily n=1 Tax=Radiomyces spectabilis TaxID=64574 RepID=UPI00221F189D|nr:ferritin-like superfamily [Radiomyces spectabilis]KAI8388731.1 ferritin-like superfamily [Radiomyces spectabilis]
MFARQLSYIASNNKPLLTRQLFRSTAYFSTKKMPTAMHISDTMLDGLIEQANQELNASNLYLSLSLWFHDQELPGSATWCRTHSAEERDHALRIFDHIIKRRAKGALIRDVNPKATFDFASPAEAWKCAFENEQENSRRIHRLMSMARKEEDWTSDYLLQWFINEQLEEESAVEDIYTNAVEVLKTNGLYRQYDEKIIHKEH